MEKSKVLIIAASLRTGGAEKVTRDIALYAPEGKYEFHYIVFGDEVGAYEAQVMEKGAKVFHWPEPAENYGRFFHSLLSLMKKENYHAVHAHNMFNCGITMLAAVLAGVPVRISHAHSAMNTGSSLVKRCYQVAMRGLILGCSTDLVACGVAAGEKLFGKTAFRKKGKLILNGIDIRAYAFDPEKRTALRQQLQLQDCLVLGHTGHLASVKNQSFLLDLMPFVLEKRPDAVLLLLGEGDDRKMLEEKVRQLRLEEKVFLPGNVSNVADYLSAMDVFVFPSLYEGLPLSILEVQANGLPCVISDSVPADVFLTDLLYPMSLSDPKEQWVEKILDIKRSDTHSRQTTLSDTEYAVEEAMGKVYDIYEKRLVE